MNKSNDISIDKKLERKSRKTRIITKRKFLDIDNLEDSVNKNNLFWFIIERISNYLLTNLYNNLFAFNLILK